MLFRLIINEHPTSGFAHVYSSRTFSSKAPTTGTRIVCLRLAMFLSTAFGNGKQIYDRHNVNRAKKNSHFVCYRCSDNNRLLTFPHSFDYPAIASARFSIIRGAVARQAPRKTETSFRAKRTTKLSCSSVLLSSQSFCSD